MMSGWNIGLNSIRVKVTLDWMNKRLEQPTHCFRMVGDDHHEADSF